MKQSKPSYEQIVFVHLGVANRTPSMLPALAKRTGARILTPAQIREQYPQNKVQALRQQAEKNIRHIDGARLFGAFPIL